MRQLKIATTVTDRSGGIQEYLNQINKYPLLSIEEEVECARRIQKNDDEAYQRLVCANLRFVVSVAKQYQNKGLTLSDLINEGNIGLMKAAQKFDETRGFKFISYAVWWVRQSILQAISEKSNIVRLPLNQVALQSKIGRARADFEQKNQRAPSVEELAEMLDVDTDRIEECLGASGKAMSVDAPYADNEENCYHDSMTGEVFASTDSKVDQESLGTDLATTLSVLNERELTVIHYLFGLNEKHEMSLEEVANMMGLTRERVRQIRENAIRHIRESANTDILRKYLAR